MTNKTLSMAHLMMGLVITVTFDVLLSIAVFALGVNTRHLSNKANHNASAVVVACQAGNRIGLAQKRLWQPILDHSPPPATPDAKRTSDEFQAALNEAGKQIDCSKL